MRLLKSYLVPALLGILLGQMFIYMVINSCSYEEVCYAE